MDIFHVIPADFSGVISICRQGSYVFQKAFGDADRANARPNRVDTKFGTASAGKVFVACAIFTLIESGRLSLDSEIGPLVDFALYQIDPKVTIRQLLNHTSGIPDYFDESVMHEYADLFVDYPNYRIRTSRDVFPLFIEKPMMYPRGERFQYNNSGYVMLGIILECVTGMPFDDYLQSVIFAPCGMNDTGYYEMDRLPANCANSYIYDAVRGEYYTNIYSIDAKGTGAGGAFTTVGDVERFWRGLYAGKIIRREHVAQMTSPQVSGDFYGYGFWLLKQGEERVPSFQGCDPGVNFITSFSEADDELITIIANYDVDVEKLYDSIRQCRLQ